MDGQETFAYLISDDLDDFAKKQIIAYQKALLFMQTHFPISDRYTYSVYQNQVYYVHKYVPVNYQPDQVGTYIRVKSLRQDRSHKLMAPVTSYYICFLDGEYQYHVYAEPVWYDFLPNLFLHKNKFFSPFEVEAMVKIHAQEQQLDPNLVQIKKEIITKP